MSTRSNQILIILLGVGVGIVVFILLYTSPVLSAWIPTPTHAGQVIDPLSGTPAELAVVQFTPEETGLVPTEVAITPAPASVTPTEVEIPGPVQEATKPPASPSILAKSFPETFSNTPPIWLHTGKGGEHEIALFRHVFDLSEPTVIAELQIFADTRYEVWLDGEWIGRGPARFSCTLREYDVYPLETLSPGRHLLAVLVQWAPNARRSESNTPLLQARIQHYTADGPTTLVQTNSDWKTISGNAWNLKAGLVHTWELIGPMELLDFRYLPENWIQPEFVDFIWGKATQTVVFGNSYRNLTDASKACSHRGISGNQIPHYQPRSISLLAYTPIIPTIRETGWLSPNRLIIEPDSTEKLYDFSFNVVQPAVFSMEVLALSSSTQITSTILLDQRPLSWTPAGENRPDVWVGLAVVQPGVHTLTNGNLGLYPVFSVFTDGVDLSTFPVNQGNHVGYRSLLAELSPNEGVIQQLTGKNLNLRIDQTPSYFVLELPRITHGRLVGTVLGPAGTVMDIGWVEKLYNDTRPLPFPGSLYPEWSQVDSWVLDGKTRELTTIDARSGRYILVAVWGKGPVQFQNLHVLEEHYPVSQVGGFESSDEFLNRVWQVGADTVKLNMVDAYVDPWRERGQWWGDAYVIDRTNRVVFGQMELLRRGVLYMADGFKRGYPVAMAPSGQGAHMLDYAMLWVQSLEAYAILNQDPAFVAQMYPTLQAFLGYLERNTSGNGLLNIRRAPWGLSNYLDSRAFFSRWGQSSAVNSMYFGTLISAANIATVVSDSVSAENWLSKAENVKNQINAILYMPDEGRYVATILSGRVYVPDPYAQAWPLAYGVVPDDEIPRVVDALLELLSDDPQNPNLEIYGMNWVFEGLARSGYFDEAIDIIANYYGYMLDANATTWWEVFSAIDTYPNARSHGWGSSPTWFLSTYILGASWTGPDTWQVRPSLEGVKNVSGTFPVGNNIIHIAWEVKSCSLAEIIITAPLQTFGELFIPYTDVTLLTLDGATLVKNGVSMVGNTQVLESSIHITLSARGQYHVIVERVCP